MFNLDYIYVCFGTCTFLRTQIEKIDETRPWINNIYFQTHWTSCDAQGASVQFEYAK